VQTARRAALAHAHARRRSPVAGRLAVADVLAALNRAVPHDRILVQENGLNDMWSYFFPIWRCGSGSGSVVPSEQTSLGFGAAAAVGVACGLPGRPVVAVVGDGAFNLFRAELPTLAQTDVSVLYVVLDNGGYGWLQAALDGRGGASRFAFTGPYPTANAEMAAVYGLAYRRVEDLADIDDALQSGWKQVTASGRSVLVEVSVALTDVPPGVAPAAGAQPSPVEEPAR
jgi:acetolactate synthase-1/2/3 large subunit